MGNQTSAIKTTYISITGNAGLAIIKWITGYLGNSFALISDAIESSADILSSILVLFGIKYSLKPPDRNHPYGHGRAEPLFTFLVVAFLMISAVIIAWQSIINITTPHQLPKSYTLIILGFIIIIKEIFYRFIVKKSKETKSSILKADAWHHRSDAITSLAAFIGISIALIFGKGYESADDWAALFASLIIFYNSYKIFRPALSEIMDENLYDDLIFQIKSTAKTVEGVLDTEKCYFRKTGLKFYMDLHISVDAAITVKEGHDISHKLKDKLKQNFPALADVLIHVEPDS
ncbi:MAG: cobalt-zinc-cadmium resistance protein [Bacteroidetes bacterium RIFCSPLOWO2_02_FULL_36_8]|nr:MAG: cobalt-zinc-cadmium resistance protein [Bacteroidetes bacterium RIFCSPLOWO2_02_FULL_36_8]OFY69283.1 MAG: cobalt-zinc-cadmium resistance protein [Bacteroidetes bacterium RIFCSPLOWO2_12_FULL_37_12]